MAGVKKLRIVGRSSSHFTRLTRIFAFELGVQCELGVLYDLNSLSTEDYAGNPALKVPILQSADGAWFGALNICRELARLSTRELRVVWPEALQQRLLANAQELATHAMASEVALIMATRPPGCWSDSNRLWKGPTASSKCRCKGALRATTPAGVEEWGGLVRASVQVSGANRKRLSKLTVGRGADTLPKHGGRTLA